MSYILELKNEFEKYNIIVGKTEKLNYDRKLCNDIDNLVNLIYKSNELHNSYRKYTIFNKQIHTLHNKTKYNSINYRNIFLSYIGINSENFISVPSFTNINNYTLYNTNKEIIDKKEVETATFLFDKKFYSHTKKERELLLQKMIIIVLYNLNNILVKNGNLTLRIYNFYDDKTFLLITLLLSHFKKGYLAFGHTLYLLGFNKNINQLLIKDIFKNNINFYFNINIQPKIQYIINYMIEYVKINIKKAFYIITNDFNNLSKFVLINNLNILLELCLYNKLDNFNFEYVLYDIFNNKYNNTFNIINIYNKIINKNNIKNILEIGSSEGIIPLYLLAQNSNINIKSLYDKNIKYNILNILLSKYKNINIIINKNSNNLINKDLIQNNNLILLYLTNNNIQYNTVKLYYLLFLMKKNSIMSIDFSNIKFILNDIDNLLENIKIKFKILYKSFNYIIIKKI